MNPVPAFQRQTLAASVTAGASVAGDRVPH